MRGVRAGVLLEETGRIKRGMKFFLPHNDGVYCFPLRSGEVREWLNRAASKTDLPCFLTH